VYQRLMDSLLVMNRRGSPDWPPLRPLLFLLRLLVFLLALSCCFAAAASAAPGSEPDLVLVRMPTGAEAPSARPDDSPFAVRYVDGCQIVRIGSADPTGRSTLLSRDFLSARDPAVSFDGRHILFAGKRKAGDPWQVWRMEADGSNPVQLTRGQADAVSPLYIGSLFHLNDAAPTPQIAYVGIEKGASAAVAPHVALYTCNLDGSSSRRITFNIDPSFDPDVLPNGRLVFSSWRPDASRLGTRGELGLMAVNMDGTDLMLFAGETGRALHMTTARVAPTGERVYYVESRTSAPLGGGDLAFVSRRRPLHSRRLLASEVGGFFHSPCPMPDGRLLASYRSGKDDVFALWEIDPETGGRLRALYSEPMRHCVDAQVLAPRPEVRGRSSIVGFRFPDTGVFYCLNVYISEHFAMKEMVPGSIKEVRIVEAMARTEEDLRDGAIAPRRVLGVAPVEPDGSFHVRVPAETPLAFQLLDEQGMAVAGQLSWTWVMPGESRLCIGCHEDRERVPPNRLAQAILKPEVPMTPPPEARRSVDYVRQVAPILRERCAACHGPEGAAPALTGGDSDFDALLGPGSPYLVPGSARQSLLLRPLLRARGAGDGADGHHGPSRLTEGEWRTLVEWIDLGAFYDSRQGGGR